MLINIWVRLQHVETRLIDRSVKDVTEEMPTEVQQNLAESIPLNLEVEALVTSLMRPCRYGAGPSSLSLLVERSLGTLKPYREQESSISTLEKNESIDQ